MKVVSKQNQKSFKKKTQQSKIHGAQGNFIILNTCIKNMRDFTERKKKWDRSHVHYLMIYLQAQNINKNKIHLNEKYILLDDRPQLK